MASFDLQGQVGLQIVGEGASATARLGRTREVIVADGHGRYLEAVRTGLVYTASIGAAGVAPGTVLSTTPPLALWNPPSSGCVAGIVAALIGYVSGTIGAGTLALGVTLGQGTKPGSGTQLTPQSNQLGNADAGPVQAFSGSTLVTTPTLVAPVATLNPTLATAPAAGGFSPVVSTLIDLGSMYMLLPGNAAALQGIAAAGTTPLVILAMVYEILKVVPGA